MTYIYDVVINKCGTSVDSSTRYVSACTILEPYCKKQAKEPAITSFRGSYRKWDEDCMKKAISAVEHGDSIRRASEKYSVP